MRETNVEIVKTVHPPSGTELTALFADDSEAPSRFEASAHYFHPEFEFSVAAIGRADGTGLSELAEMWRDWMEPWGVYWTEIEDFVEASDERVLVLLRDHGRLRGGEEEVELLGANLWTVRDGKIARIDFFTNRADALEAAGLSE